MASSSLINIRKKSSSTTKTRAASSKSQDISPRLKNFPPEEIRKVFEIPETNLYSRKNNDNDRGDVPMADISFFPNDNILPPNNTKSEIPSIGHGGEFENQNRNEICDSRNVAHVKNEEITNWKSGNPFKAGCQHQNPVFSDQCDDSRNQNHVPVCRQNPPQNFAHDFCNSIHSRCSQNLANNSRKCQYDNPPRVVHHEQRNHQPPKSAITSNYTFTPEMLQDQRYLLSMLKRQEIPESVIARQFNSLLDEQKRQLIHMEQFSRQEEEECQVKRKITKPQGDRKPQWMAQITPPRISHHDSVKIQNADRNFHNSRASDYSQNCKKNLGPSSLLKLRVYKDVVKPQKSSNGLQDPDIVKRNLETLKELESRTGFRNTQNFENQQTKEIEHFRPGDFTEHSTNAMNEKMRENFGAGVNYCQCVCPNQDGNLLESQGSNCYERQNDHDNFKNYVSRDNEHFHDPCQAKMRARETNDYIPKSHNCCSEERNVQPAFVH